LIYICRIYDQKSSVLFETQVCSLGITWIYWVWQIWWHRG